MIYSFGAIVNILENDESHMVSDMELRIPLLDSRQLSVPKLTLFFALKGLRNHGNKYIGELYRKGVRCFISDDETVFQGLEEANYIIVSDVLLALQQLALHHRQQYNIPVIGITGSEHKTLIKEWLYELLREDYNIVKSPGSYNSQYGVPLSILQITDRHTLGIFEAGISEMGQMDNLEAIIRPTIGILTTVESAYDLHFSDVGQRLTEYLKLFDRCPRFIIHEEFENILSDQQRKKALVWGQSETSEYQLRDSKQGSSQRELLLYRGNQRFQLDIGSKDEKQDLVQYKIICLILANAMGHGHLLDKIAGLTMPDLGVKTIAGINGTTILHDVYCRDLLGFRATLSKAKMIQDNRKIWIVFSKEHPIPQLDEFWNMISESASYQDVDRVYLPAELEAESASSSSYLFSYPSYQGLIDELIQSASADQTILIFGGTGDTLQSLVYQMQDKRHSTVLEIDLSALNKNLKAFEHYLYPSTKLMVMVKANAYGAGALKVAQLLQGRRIDYLGVAFTDEGIELRRAGIVLPIMVLNVDPLEFESLVEYQLEPEIFSLELLKNYQDYLEKRNIVGQKIHIKLDTGMHRLGFLPDQLDELIQVLRNTDAFEIQSVFSHLSASGDLSEQEFTEGQINLFIELSDKLKSELAVDFDRHILNSAGIVRYPQYQFDMVRLGIGMYGVGMESVEDQIVLRPVHNLKSRISQIKTIPVGDSVGYSRAAKVERITKIGVIRIGYADGLMRLAGNGRFKVMVNQQFCPTLGNVCMDMTMIDLTDHPNVSVGDEVVIFGSQYSIEELSSALMTISYEILTHIDHRVNRIYVSN
ncbi:bifunctional UDP-N-acetylmuramoyl-tripeptide:D-alanyl-D-alanine ligase/alanine racemase [Membranihabitans marinus]|uniref:bifunctional UDP-N-acetylmuramoyl-tripeptide:D-alanyl-D-alanine ligase/alanine racemase n=1 Tax=Membranihabitans marinus TaxID=1227546 RepID=UPI001EFF6525|nr:bifunctional UDP-N-acetylmuramoyl-tripeptide:D-alanyl-D-alanine ligase/alanine racemase [Membranihabitans marinus]